MVKALTADQVRALPASVPVRDAARALGIGEDLAYDLIASKQWPTHVLKLGRAYRITRSSLLAVLEIPEFPETSDEPESHTGS